MLSTRRLLRWEWLFVGLLVIVGGFFRLYRLRATAIFLGDQGRDAIIAANILKKHDIALIGPVTSVGNMYLGPFYYYFMVPWLALTYPDPIGPALGVAIIGTITLALFYQLTKEMFGQTTAIIGSLLYTISRVVIQNTRFSWNPNLAPIFGLCITYFLWKAITTKNSRYLLISLVVFGLIIQLHYLALLLGFVILGVFIYLYITSHNRTTILRNLFLGIAGICVLLLPLLVFDIRHDFINAKAFQSFITSKEEHLRPIYSLGRTLQETLGRSHKIIPQLLGSPNFVTDRVILTLFAIGAVFNLNGYSKIKKRTGFILLLTIIITTIIGTSFYTSSLFDHYLGFIYPTIFMTVGAIMATIYSQGGIIGKIVVGCGLGYLAIINLQKSPAFATNSPTMDQIQLVSQSILNRVQKSEKYNIVLISAGGDIDANNYRYFLETSQTPPLAKENRGETDTLFIIDEMRDGKRAIDSPSYEIVVFPNKEPVETYSLESGQQITVLKRK